MINKEIILGTAQFGLRYGINNNSDPLSNTSINNLLDLAFAHGIITLDTAEAYGNSESIIGNYHNSSKSKFRINTKFRNGQKGELKKTLTRSLNKLQVECVNTYYFHSYAEYIKGLELLDEIKSLKYDDHLIENIGVSVYTNDELADIIKNPIIDVIQFPFNLLDNYTKRGQLLRNAKANGKIIHIRSVFLQGLFFKNVSSLPSYLYPLKVHLEKLNRLCKESNISMESLCLKYCYSQKDIDAIIIGVDSDQQLMSNLLSIDTTVSQQVYKLIDSIDVKESELLYPFNWKS